ncbi:MAG: anthranilate synthase component I family protein [Saprospiraceae bacterium]|nr:anthranilate synthase component I family protein [Saprospiraceae bacterium]
MEVLEKIKIRTQLKRQLADMHTPVSIYLKIRDKFTESCLLESTDFRSAENCFSFIAIEPIARFIAQNSVVTETFLDGAKKTQTVDNHSVVPLFKQFIEQFEVENEAVENGKTDGTMNGFFGHTAYDAVQYFDTIKFDKSKRKNDLPDMHYALYRFVIAINHFKDEMTILENIPEGSESEMARLETILNSQTVPTFGFILRGSETSNLTDDEFLQHVRLCKHHCQIGDVFQIVPSRNFAQPFEGDEFQVYRALRSINPSPYLFYFDYGFYKIFGSSPEQQLVIKNRVASVNPIAGTYRRTGDDAQDAELARALARDPKENAEHIMLVDLARNDLGKHCKSVKVKELRDIQFFSHVIHIVSKVEGELLDEVNAIDVFADTFPAGTLSGAPKYKAMQLIDQFENQNRHFYGGGIGFFGFNGDSTHAIVIRSFLSKDNVLYRQAGCGVVVSSVEETELQEVGHKLGALRKALLEAERIA